jgi:hypothetical protein
MIATLDRFADDEIPVPEGTSAAELSLDPPAEFGRWLGGISGRLI